MSPRLCQRIGVVLSSWGCQFQVDHSSSIYREQDVDLFLYVSGPRPQTYLTLSEFVTTDGEDLYADSLCDLFLTLFPDGDAEKEGGPTALCALMNIDTEQ